MVYGGLQEHAKDEIAVDRVRHFLSSGSYHVTCHGLQDKIKSLERVVLGLRLWRWPVCAAMNVNGSEFERLQSAYVLYVGLLQMWDLRLRKWPALLLSSELRYTSVACCSWTWLDGTLLIFYHVKFRKYNARNRVIKIQLLLVIFHLLNYWPAKLMPAILPMHDLTTSY
jgi:hypothetical protein